MSRIGRLGVTVLAAVGGLIVGFIGGIVGSDRPPPDDLAFLAEYIPLPHHVPKSPSGASFRFAMAHDVIHERFPRHGPAYYRERNRLTRKKLETLSPDAPAALSLTDDLAAGLDRLGDHDAAVALMRDKLARQLGNGLAGPVLYTTYANLGTFLLHASRRGAVAGDLPARARFREGVGYIRKAVELNPEAHFGREQWEAALAEFLLASMEDPQLLKTFDCLGHRLDADFEKLLHPEATHYGRSHDPLFGGHGGVFVMALFVRSGGALDDPSRWEEVRRFREHITKIGAEKDWEKVPVPSHRNPVPFDEPVLGLVGLWRQGRGADPHLALALGEALLRVGQRYLAWTAYERAALMGERFWPDADLQRFLRDHCRRRQAEIEAALAHDRADEAGRRPRHVGTPPAEETVAGLRPTFEAELAYGEGYQRAYQRYEEEKIAAKVPIGEPTFFDDFHAGREPIASPSGPEEWFGYLPSGKAARYIFQHALNRGMVWGVFGAGLAAMAAALLLRWGPSRPKV